MDSARYAELFLTESRENLSAINHSLLEIERTGGAAEPVSALFRAVHTVKGMSATMGFAAVTELTHEMETLLDRIRRGSQTVTQPIMDTLFKCADALERSIEQSVSGGTDQVGVQELVRRLRAHAPAAEGGAAAPAAPRPSTSSVARSGWTAPMPAGQGTLIRVRLAEGAPLRGVRAFLILQKAKSLGTIQAVSPSVDALQAEEFGLDFALRLATTSDPATIERTLRTAGDIEAIEISAAAGGPAAGAAATAAAPAPVDAGWASEGAQLRQQRHVRIDLRRLDHLMNLIGELVITRGRLAQLAAGIADPALDEAITQASRLISDLQDGIMTSRMVPVWQVFDRFPRLVRDAARSLGKQVTFSIDGKDIELDRSMLDEIGDPIVHLLRNAIDHGIETPDTRLKAGKPSAGSVTLSAMRDRSAVLIRVTDDGKGIDRAKVLKKAKETGLVDAARSELADDELIRLISRAGFSTADRVTDISGRGVGIDVVQTRVRALGGSLEIKSVPGQGTTVIVRLPITLAILRALLARVNDEVYALPMTHVNETVEVGPDALRTVKGREVLVLRDDVMPLLHLRDLVKLPRAPNRTQQIVVLEVADRRAGLVVDALTGQQEIVVKQFDAVRGGLTLFSGATILGDGAPALIVDVGSLL